MRARRSRAVKFSGFSTPTCDRRKTRSRESKPRCLIPGVSGGCFSLRYPRPEWIYRVSDSLGNLGAKVFGFALGDHGIFCRRAAFDCTGGYPLVPILEDAELYRRLVRVGRMTQVPEVIVSDPRTFESCGRYRTTAVYFLILLLYVAGLPVSALNRIYRHFHRKGFGVAVPGTGRLGTVVS
jgi:hypothetical protein